MLKSTELTEIVLGIGCSIHLMLVRLHFSYDLLAKSNTIIANIHSIRANGQVLHLSLFFTTERAAQPTLLLWFFRPFAKCSDTFVTNINTSRSSNETLNLVLVFAAKGTNVDLPPPFSHHTVRFSCLSLSDLHIADVRILYLVIHLYLDCSLSTWMVFARASCKLRPKLSSTPAPMPFPSRINPNRRCSVPI